MATFYDNLRASRSGTKDNSTNSLPTRGDMQKQRQGDVDPNAFYNFLRMALGIRKVQKPKEQLGIDEVPPQNIDKASPIDSDAATEAEEENEELARKGTLYQENNLDKFNASVNGTSYVPRGGSAFDKAYGVLENYDKLNKLLDDYDSINTWSGKRAFLKNAYKEFDDKYGDLSKWFDKLYGHTLEAQQFGEWDTKAVSNVMRDINEYVKNKFLKLS